MAQARQWSAVADRVICDMRAGGETWAAIGRALGLSRSTVIERGRRLRAVAPPPRVTLKNEDEEMLKDPNRPALRAGHPLTWGLLTGEAFPEGELK
ncbi:AsnC family protein [Acidocella sp.]|uniref:AsnC family protein n=1 Tax=Acidocella sp. TaxID=50710 RepID=UPI002617EA6C|nr:AsnC family protein [Acidocella sp.]